MTRANLSLAAKHAHAAVYAVCARPPRLTATMYEGGGCSPAAGGWAEGLSEGDIKSGGVKIFTEAYGTRISARVPVHLRVCAGTIKGGSYTHVARRSTDRRRG